MAVSLGTLNPFGKFDIGAGAIGNALILFLIIFVVFGLIGLLIALKITARKYKFKIPLYKSINGRNLRQAIYKAKVVPISKAGDTLWFVAGVKKFIAPAVLTDAQNSFPHEERDDGEWINFAIGSVNEEQKRAGVVFIQQDMRTQRVATGQILEQRLINKGFWDKYKDMIIQMGFYVITTMLLIVIFWQWGNIVDKVGMLIGKLEEVGNTFADFQCIGAKAPSIIPDFILPMISGGKR